MEMRGGVKKARTFQRLVSVLPQVAVCPLRRSFRPSYIFKIKFPFPSYAYSTGFLLLTTKMALLHFPAQERQEQKGVLTYLGKGASYTTILTLSRIRNVPGKGEEEMNGGAP